jgi:hypothetical protein
MSWRRFSGNLRLRRRSIAYDSSENTLTTRKESAMNWLVPENDTLQIDDIAIEELDEVAAADCAGTASTASTPVSTAACVGCASF